MPGAPDHRRLPALGQHEAELEAGRQRHAGAVAIQTQRPLRAAQSLHQFLRLRMRQLRRPISIIALGHASRAGWRPAAQPSRLTNTGARRRPDVGRGIQLFGHGLAAPGAGRMQSEPGGGDGAAAC
jgi:hypothetical protein